MESCKIHSYFGLLLIYKVTLFCTPSLWLSNRTEGTLMDVLDRLILSISGWPQTVCVPELALHVLVL